MPAVAGPLVAPRPALKGRHALVALAAAIACGTLGIALDHNGGGASRSAVAGVLAHSYRQQGLLSLPAAAQGPVSATLGEDSRGYRMTAVADGYRAASPAQGLALRFTRSGVRVKSRQGQSALALRDIGRGTHLHAVSGSVPKAAANRISYALGGGLREWYANGPLGLEQGFDLERSPGSGSGPLTLSLALSGNLRARRVSGGISLTGHGAALRYAGLVVRDARGRELRAWLELRPDRILIRIADRGARYPLRIDPWMQSGELATSDAIPDAYHGDSVAVSGNTIVVGASHANDGAGGVYVFTRPASGWANATQTAKLTASNPQPGDPSVTVGAELGFSVAISGSTIVAGAPYYDGTGTSYQGAMYEWTLPQSGVWTNATQTAFLTASDGGNDDFLGWSVAVDGSTIVGGAEEGEASPAAGPGAVYVFTMPASGGWVSTTQTAELVASDGALGDSLGGSVAVSGSTIVAGAAGHAPPGSPNGEFQGAVYVWTMPASGHWVNATETAELTASDGGPYDALGNSVAVSGSTIVGGAPDHVTSGAVDEGAVYVWTLPASGRWTYATQNAELTAHDAAAGLEGEFVGLSVALSGSMIFAGGGPTTTTVQGAVYGWTLPAGGLWTNATQTAELTASDGTGGNGFGFLVAASGSTLAVAAPYTGKAYVFGGGYTVSGHVYEQACGEDTCSLPVGRVGQNVLLKGTTTAGDAFSAVAASDAKGAWSIVAPPGYYTAAPVERDGVTPVGPAYDPETREVTVTGDDVPNQDFSACGLGSQDVTPSAAADGQGRARAHAMTGQYTESLCKSDYTITIAAQIGQNRIVDPSLESPYLRSSAFPGELYPREEDYSATTGVVAQKIYGHALDSVLEIYPKYPGCFSSKEVKDFQKDHDQFWWYTYLEGGPLGQVDIPLVFNQSVGTHGTVYFASPPTRDDGQLTRVWVYRELDPNHGRPQLSYGRCKLTAQVAPIYYALPGGADKGNGIVSPTQFSIVVLWYIPFQPAGEVIPPDTSAKHFLEKVMSKEHAEALVEAWESIPFVLKFPFYLAFGHEALGLLAKGPALLSRLSGGLTITNEAVKAALALAGTVPHILEHAHSIWDVGHELSGTIYGASVAGLAGLFGAHARYPVMGAVVRGSFTTTPDPNSTKANPILHSTTFALSVKTTGFPNIAVQVSRQTKPNRNGECPVGGNAYTLPWKTTPVSYLACPIVTNPFQSNPANVVNVASQNEFDGEDAIDRINSLVSDFKNVVIKVLDEDSVSTDMSYDQGLADPPKCSNTGVPSGKQHSTICWVFKDGRP